jgi:tetratricopeptide (TPR) repeat protein
MEEGCLRYSALLHLRRQGKAATGGELGTAPVFGHGKLVRFTARLQPVATGSPQPASLCFTGLPPKSCRRSTGNGRLGQRTGGAAAYGHPGRRVEAYAGDYADAARWFERTREVHPASSQYAVILAGVYDQLGRVGDAVTLLENGPQQWRSDPAVRIWLGLSYALAGRKEQAAAEFAAYRALAPKRTLSYLRRVWSRYYKPQFADRILALSGEYDIPEK